MTAMRIISAFGLALILGACSTHQYAPPPHYDNGWRLQFKESPEVIWDRIIKHVGHDAYTVESIERDSRILNVSFSPNKASKYVDCGIVTVELPRVKFVYNPADDSIHDQSTSQGYQNVSRKTDLKARANIYVEDDYPYSVVSANVTYTLDVAATIMTYRGVGGFSDVVNEHITLTTREPYQNMTTLDGKVVNFRCESTGVLEERLVDLANVR
jgi:hypothetical protein